jgi:hypothetical protein
MTQIDLLSCCLKLEPHDSQTFLRLMLRLVLVVQFQSQDCVSLLSILPVDSGSEPVRTGVGTSNSTRRSRTAMVKEDCVGRVMTDR